MSRPRPALTGDEVFLLFTELLQGVHPVGELPLQLDVPHVQAHLGTRGGGRKTIRVAACCEIREITEGWKVTNSTVMGQG